MKILRTLRLVDDLGATLGGILLTCFTGAFSVIALVLFLTVGVSWHMVPIQCQRWGTNHARTVKVVDEGYWSRSCVTLMSDGKTWIDIGNVRDTETGAGR